MPGFIRRHRHWVRFFLQLAPLALLLVYGWNMVVIIAVGTVSAYIGLFAFKTTR